LKYVGGDINTVKKFLMKRFIGFSVLLACLLVMSVVFVSCDNGNGTTSGGDGDIVGTWAALVTEDGLFRGEFVFNANGTFILRLFFRESDGAYI
jgi:hypothetical protein